MAAPTGYIIQDQQFWLSHDRAIFWEQEETLILSDLHFGKTGHFRKNGIGVPQLVNEEDLQRITNLIRHFKPKKLLVVGDLFHSVANQEMELFAIWRKEILEVSIILVKGNHDILASNWYEENNISIKTGRFTMAGFNFVHDPAENRNESITANFTFSGHLHPGVNIAGFGKQSLRFPCFYFTNNSAVLPAFSRFSGMAIVNKKKASTIFAIVNDTLIEIEKGY